MLFNFLLFLDFLFFPAKKFLTVPDGPIPKVRFNVDAANAD